ncbi:hypothetical protein DFQ28_007192 [Apophysomyces sp. BC1034]|nr:hypothetical protein DFQ30_007096 [Apophysomyces sp. BC1015]KAG0176594.1 hypothetical protein DFQ29_005940 [Apophysomyces sp. BC1021]KAG0186868.1 hypothetical protein DFQ28_007192 [Apophysomyces sp. BC1034]
MAKSTAKETTATTATKPKAVTESEPTRKARTIKVIPPVSSQTIQENLITPPDSLAIQTKTCLSTSYQHFSNRCRACVSKKTDMCRFRDLRAFEVRDKELKYGPYFVSTTEVDGIRERTRGISTKSQAHRKYLRKTIRNAFLKMLQEDRKLISQCDQTLRRRPMFSDIRHVCDICLTSIFNLYWMCGVCGLDICPGCYQEGWQSGNSRLMNCTYRRTHTREHMVPVVKYDEKVSEKLYTEAMNIDTEKEPQSKYDCIQNPCNDAVCLEDVDALKTLQKDSTCTEQPQDDAILQEQGVVEKACVNTVTDTRQSYHAKSFQVPVIEISKGRSSTEVLNDHNKSMSPDLSFEETVNSIPAKQEQDVLISSADQVTLEEFQQHWSLGKPVVIQNVLKMKKNIWTPQYFQKKYGKQTIDVTDCNTGDVEKITVDQFFKGFTDHTKRHNYDPKRDNYRVLKIKDWPPKADFMTEFPELYRNFMQMLPVPEYCTARGYFNLSNRLPKEYVPPDLGPKMFIAYGSGKNDNNHGTTKLHCDMADAVNVMCHAHVADNNAAATWDIYPAESLPVLREFVAKVAEKEGLKVRDPIHSQWLYLDDKLQDQLWREHGVKSWRVYQNFGDAVYIPAGCAHQVSNNHSAIKCAYDFVSPECVERAAMITKQLAQVPREDALQLNNTLLFAWTSSDA